VDLRGVRLPGKQDRAVPDDPATYIEVQRIHGAIGNAHPGPQRAAAVVDLGLREVERVLPFDVPRRHVIPGRVAHDVQPRRDDERQLGLRNVPRRVVPNAHGLSRAYHTMRGGFHEQLRPCRVIDTAVDRRLLRLAHPGFATHRIRHAAGPHFLGIKRRQKAERSSAPQEGVRRANRCGQARHRGQRRERRCRVPVDVLEPGLQAGVLGTPERREVEDLTVPGQREVRFSGGAAAVAQEIQAFRHGCCAPLRERSALQLLKHWRQELRLVQMCIDAVHRHQFVVCASFHNSTAIDHQDLGGALHSGQTVRDDQRCPPEHERLHGVLDEPLSAQVDAGGGLVEHEDPWLSQNDSRQTDQLALAK